MSFGIEEPQTIAEAVGLLAAAGGAARPIAGGTGLTPLIKNGFYAPETLISLRRLRDPLGRIEVADDGALVLGALATLRRVERSPGLGARAPALHAALVRLATVRLRNVATVGGAVAFAHPQMDLPAGLLAVDATIRVTGPAGERTIAAADFYRGAYETAIGDDELIVAVTVPPWTEPAGTYRKVTARTVDDWPLLGVAVTAARPGGEVGAVRVAVGALTDRPQRLTDVEEALSGIVPSPDSIREAAAGGAASLDYRDGPTTGARYLRALTATHLRRALEDVLLPAAGAPR